MFNAYYIIRVSLPGWLIPLATKGFLGYYSAFDRIDYVIYREKSAIYRQNCWYITRYPRFWGISSDISSNRYFSMKYRVDLSRYMKYRQYIAIFSSYLWLLFSIFLFSNWYKSNDILKLIYNCLIFDNFFYIRLK